MFYSLTKRGIDVAGALLLLFALLPVFFLVGLAVKATSHGPCFFIQYRIGRHGRLFPMLKFRSMRQDAKTPLPQNGRLIKFARDPRVTAVGRMLRRTSLDEMPQLINVLLGHMSLVGPRPLMPHMIAPFPGFAATRNLVRPGMSGLWQIRARGQSSHVRFMINHDLEYIERASLWLDLRILIRTPLTVMRGEGAL